MIRRCYPAIEECTNSTTKANDTIVNECKTGRKGYVLQKATSISTKDVSFVVKKVNTIPPVICWTSTIPHGVQVTIKVQLSYAL